MRRLCLECGDDWTSWASDPLCPSCLIDHELRGRPLALGKYPDPGTWGYEGITVDQVDVEAGDLDGFYVATLTDGDFAYEGSESYV